jgi:adenylate cyclase
MESSHEIERKFLLSEPLEDVLSRYEKCQQIVIEQRYLPSTGDWTTRIRQSVCEGKVEHWITFKRKLNNVRSVEMETRVDAEFYSSMTTQCGPPLRKIRNKVEHSGHTWEIDLFLDPVFERLVVAEIELTHEGELFVRPDWLGMEVTNDRSYKNAKMVKRLTSS